MSTIQAPNNYCSFTVMVFPNQQFAFELVSNMGTVPGTIVAYLPSVEELQTVGQFLVAALNYRNPSPISLSQENSQRTLSMSASGSTVTITLYEGNISTTLSVAFSTVYHWIMLSTAASTALAWSGGQADRLVAPAPSLG
jgi:hypothetical protein